MKIALLVAYDGTDFHGFARQRSARTVQGELENRLALIAREDIDTTGAGRTDTGVHAAGQVISFAFPRDVEPGWITRRLNKMLAPEISVRAAAVVKDGFDARFSARARAYEYRCYHAASPDPFLDRFTLHVGDAPNVRAMREGARALIGEHDFSSFCRRGQGSMTRNVRSISIVTTGEMLTFKIRADSFCHQMVRSVVGILLDVGVGKRAPADVGKALRARDRNAAGTVAPARGLHLVKVSYRPDPFKG